MGKRALVVEDDQTEWNEIDRYLSEYGFDCTLAPNANRFLEILQLGEYSGERATPDYDLVIVDTELPEAVCENPYERIMEGGYPVDLDSPCMGYNLIRRMREEGKLNGACVIGDSSKEKRIEIYERIWDEMGIPFVDKRDMKKAVRRIIEIYENSSDG